MRVVLDTNVLIAAFVARGLCSDLLERVLSEHVLFTCGALMAELRRVMTEKLRFSRARVDDAVGHMVAHSTAVELGPIESSACRDPDDVHVLALCRDAAAEVLVTGDDDLLVLGSFGDTKIVRPREFLLLQGGRKD